MLRVAFAGLIALCATGCVADRLGAAIEGVINGPDYRQAHWGLLVADLGSGRTVYEKNADKLFAPASVTKLYTVATALDALGADYRFATPVYRRGEVDKEGVLAGDLILVAAGDPTLGGRTDAAGRVAFRNSDHTYAGFFGNAELTEPDPLAGLNELARQTAASGIRRVNGGVFVDDRMFDQAQGTGSGPSRLTPIMVNDNVIDFVITPAAEVGKSAVVTWRPQTSAYTVDARVETLEKGKDPLIAVSLRSPGRLVVRGRVAAGGTPLVRIHEVEDPVAFAQLLFIESLQRAGVAVAAPAGDKLPEYRKDHRVALFTSPPFSEHARLILKVSHNLHASTLPLLVAVKKGGRTLEDGLRLQKNFLVRAGVDAETISFAGGAGGARADFTTPRATVQLLSHMAAKSAYVEALPILGVDGTLATAIGPESPARGRVRAKTGTLVWHNAMNDRYLLTSKALAGYVTTSRGRTLAVALFVNNTHIGRPGDSAREGKVLARLCEILCAAE